MPGLVAAAAVVSEVPRIDVAECSTDAYVQPIIERLRIVRPRLVADAPVWLFVEEDRMQVSVDLDRRDEQVYWNKREKQVRNLAVRLPLDAPTMEPMTKASEKFVGLLLGRAVDCEIHHGGDDCDLFFHGLSVDVKWSPREDAQLLVNCFCFDKGPKDIYVLVTGPGPESFMARGWATRAEVEVARKFDPTGRGAMSECHALHQSELHPMQALVAVSGRPKVGEILGLPWRTALAMSADGWWWHDQLVVGGSVVDDALLLFSPSARPAVRRITRTINRHDWIERVVERAPEGSICDPFDSERVALAVSRAGRRLVRLWELEEGKL